MIQCDTTKILLDALFGGWESTWYHVPSDSVIRLMRAALPPFDDVDLVLVTHNHIDHFDPDITASHLRNNQDAVLICTPQAERMLASAKDYSEVNGRIRTVSAPPDSMVALSMGGTDLRMLCTPHSPYIETDSITGEKIDRNRDLQHLEFIISVGGWVLFHCGDGTMADPSKYRSFGFGSKPIDVAFVQAWNAGDQLSYRQLLVRDVIRPARVILMHRHPDRALRGDPERQNGIAGEVILPRRHMETWIFD